MNYYNYFTEVEDHFRMARDSGMFMMSPLDWALVEAWKDAGIPLEAVLKGIDRAFEKYRRRKRRYGTVNSVAYCTQEVMGAARESAPARRIAAQQAPPGFDGGRLAGFFREHAARLRQLAGGDGPGSGVFDATATALEGLAVRAAAGDLDDLEDVERRLGALEDRVAAVAAGALSEEQLLAARRDLDARLKPYRRKMPAEQIAMLEQRFLRRRSLEGIGLSRLSLFYAD